MIEEKDKCQCLQAQGKGFGICLAAEIQEIRINGKIDKRCKQNEIRYFAFECRVKKQYLCNHKNTRKKLKNHHFHPEYFHEKRQHEWV